MSNPLAKVDELIGKYGWYCLHVHPTEGTEQEVFSYTIGLYATYGHPEIMVFGMPTEKAHGILSECADLIKAGNRFPVGEPVPDVLSGDYKVIFRPVQRSNFNEYLGTALRYYGPKDFSALVLFWPDREHRFPWESENLSTQAEALNVV